MKVDPMNVTIAELVACYDDKGEEGVRGYNGELNIRPAYQREFIYGEKQRNAVISTVLKGFPLNTMYWAVSESGYELMDGQQRTVSICQYVQGYFSVDVSGSPRFFGNLTKDAQQKILNYVLHVYACEGTEDEKLDWFRVINIAGAKLTDQELRNAIYTGTWLTDAKRWFSKTGCPAAKIGEPYVNGSPIRQEILEQSLDWISNGKIEDYMSQRQNDGDAQDLWQYYQSVISWVSITFPETRKIMKGLDWGRFYNIYGSKSFNAAKLEEQVRNLILDDEVENKRGIYEYLLSGNENTLNIRTFSEKIKTAVYEEQKGICKICGDYFLYNAMEADHIIPWSKGGKTVSENCQLLCRMDNRTKSGK